MEENHMRNLLVAQSGGPTAAINATVAGVVSCAVLSGKVDHIYGAVNGIEGVLAEKFLDLGKKLDSAEKISLLMQTPAAALGSCRYKLGDPKENTEDFEEILRIFRRHEIRYFIYIGGNDSMDTVNKLSKYCKENGVEDVFVVGAPKTIDNDLVGTDHCPGFGSAAKYLAATFAELERDCHVYEKKAVTIVEVMGRNAGWLTAVPQEQGHRLKYLHLPCFRPVPLKGTFLRLADGLPASGNILQYSLPQESVLRQLLCRSVESVQPHSGMRCLPMQFPGLHQGDRYGILHRRFQWLSVLLHLV